MNLDKEENVNRVQLSTTLDLGLCNKIKRPEKQNLVKTVHEENIQDFCNVVEHHEVHDICLYRLMSSLAYSVAFPFVFPLKQNIGKRFTLIFSSFIFRM